MPLRIFQGVTVLLPLLLALLVCGLIVLLSGGDPVAALSALCVGSFGSAQSAASTLTRATPLALLGLGVSLAFRAGMFNIGGEGQLYTGGLAAAGVGAASLGLPGAIHLPLALLAGVSAGAMWGGIAGWLRARRGVHEVIVTIMLNYIAIHLTDGLVNGPMAAGAGLSQTRPIQPSALMPVLWSAPPSGVHAGGLLALGLCVCGYVLLFRTPWGYEVRAVGHNPLAGEAAGIDVPGTLLGTMALAGALSGLAGAVEVCGVHRTFYAQFSPGYGFDAIAVALLGRSHPLGVLPAALLFGAVRTADRYLQLSAGVPRDLVVILQGAVIFFVGAESISKAALRRISRTPDAHPSTRPSA